MCILEVLKQSKLKVFTQNAYYTGYRIAELLPGWFSSNLNYYVPILCDKSYLPAFLYLKERFKTLFCFGTTGLIMGDLVLKLKDNIDEQNIVWQVWVRLMPLCWVCMFLPLCSHGFPLTKNVILWEINKDKHVPTNPQ